jgi:hypothetical protein
MMLLFDQRTEERGYGEKAIDHTSGFKGKAGGTQKNQAG